MTISQEQKELMQKMTEEEYQQIVKDYQALEDKFIEMKDEHGKMLRQLLDTRDKLELTAEYKDSAEFRKELMDDIKLMKRSYHELNVKQKSAEPDIRANDDIKLITEAKMVIENLFSMTFNKAEEMRYEADMIIYDEKTRSEMLRLLLVQVIGNMHGMKAQFDLMWPKMHYVILVLRQNNDYKAMNLALKEENERLKERLGVEKGMEAG